MTLRFITTDLIFIIYTIICLLINLIFYLDYISTEFYNGLNHYEDNEDKYNIKSYWAYCCDNWFLFTINTLQLVLTIGVIIYNFFYFYG